MIINGVCNSKLALHNSEESFSKCPMHLTESKQFKNRSAKIEPNKLLKLRKFYLNTYKLSSFKNETFKTRY